MNPTTLYCPLLRAILNFVITFYWYKSNNPKVAGSTPVGRCLCHSLKNLRSSVVVRYTVCLVSGLPAGHPNIIFIVQILEYCSVSTKDTNDGSEPVVFLKC